MNYPRSGFIYDCNNQSLTALQVLKGTLENPVGNTKRIIIEGYSFPNMSNIAATATFYHMPTTNLPTTSYAPLPYLVGTDISSPGNTALFKANVTLAASPMSGGTNIISVPVKGGDRNYIEGAPLTLTPGTIIGFQLNPGVIMANVSLVIYTREENI